MDNILPNIYLLIERLENEIGNGAKVKISLLETDLLIRVDWWPDNFHAMQRFNQYEMITSARPEQFILDHFVAYCKGAHKSRKNP